MSKNIDMIEKDLKPKKDYINYLLILLIAVVVIGTGFNYYNGYNPNKLDNANWIEQRECFDYYNDGYRTYTGRSNYTCAEDRYQLGKCERVDFGLEAITYNCECLENPKKNQDIICVKEINARRFIGVANETLAQL